MKGPDAINQCVPEDALVALDRVNTAIIDSTSLDDMLQRVLDQVLAVFSADRAWVMYPCDPDVDAVHLRAERTRPKWPGAFAGCGR